MIFKQNLRQVLGHESLEQQDNQKNSHDIVLRPLEMIDQTILAAHSLGLQENPTVGFRKPPPSRDGNEGILISAECILIIEMTRSVIDISHRFAC